MRIVAVGVVSILVATAVPAWPRCGDDPTDAAVVAAAVDRVAAQCRCCSRADYRTFSRCTATTVSGLVQQGTLRRACAGTVRQTVRRQCRGGEFSCATPVPTSTPTPVGSVCQADGDCDDANGCSADRCADGTCLHECLCVGPSGGACCAGPTAGGTYFFTCGDPVCRGHTRTDLAPCAPEQKPGAPCCPDQSCDPGDDCNRALVCAMDDPTNGGMCPISRRAAKRNIHYLGDQDRARLRDQLLEVKLATYEYALPGLPDGAHLGFIIDDVGRESPSVAADGDHVDLYGYTSLAVAAIQEQAREIATLRRELAALRAELQGARTSRHR